MFVLFAAGVIFAFLVLGAAVFVICGLVPPMQRFALSAALWCALWGPCVMAWIVIAGAAVFANDFASQATAAHGWHLPAWPSGIRRGYLVVCISATGLLATMTAWLHQMFVRQMTFALFRIYATLVSAGVGSVWGVAVWIWLGAEGWGVSPPAAFFSATAPLPVGFGWAGFRWARRLRGTWRPTFSLVSQAEFEGSV